MTIPRKIIKRLYSCTCSIGYFTVPIEEYERKPLDRVYEVIGTGFLVRSNLVMTNRHVINSLRTAITDLKMTHELLFVRFLKEIGKGFVEWSYVPKKIQIYKPEEVDVGFIEFIDDAENKLLVKPVEFTNNLPSLFPGQPVGVVGFPYGTEGLAKPYSNQEIYRFGPVLQQGYISAIAPYHGKRTLTKLLLDIRTAKGMSGAAVFLPQTGEVIGIHEGGTEWTLAYAIPLDQKSMKNFLDKFDNTPPTDIKNFPL